MDRQTLSIVAPLVQKEFTLDNAQLGLLFSAFYISYGVSVALMGEALDRISLRIAFAAVVFLWSLATVLTSVSVTFWQLALFRMLLGIGEAGNWPATARLVSMYLAPNQRTLANSIYMGGGSLGLVIVSPLMVWLSRDYGWRAGFIAIGSISLVWIVAWLFWFTPARTSQMVRHDHVPEGRAPDSWSQILRVPRFWGLVIASLFGNGCLYFLMNWMPTFLIQDRQFKFDLKLGGVIVVPFLGLDLGYILSGFLVLRLSKSLNSVLAARRLVLMASALLMSASVCLIPFMRGDLETLVLLFGTTLGMAGWNSNYLCFVEEVSVRKVSAVAGAVGSAGALAGAVSQPLIGMLSQAAGSFDPIFFIVGGAIWCASAGILFTSERRHEGGGELAHPATA